MGIGWIFGNDLVISKKIWFLPTTSEKAIYIYFFNKNLILNASLIFTPLTPAISYSEAAVLYWRFISFSLHNIRFNIFDLLTFFSRFYLLTGKMPLKSWLPLLVQCRFFKPINCVLWPSFSDGYAIFKIFIFL